VVLQMVQPEVVVLEDLELGQLIYCCW